MAASYGERILGEVTETGLDEFLHDLRDQAGDEHDGYLGVKSLDEGLEAFTRESRKEPVVEIASTTSAAGKSQLLYYLAAISVLPSACGGRSAAVVYIDTDGRFDAHRLRTVAMGIAQNYPPADADADTATATVENSLQHVHVFQPPSSGSLLATLQTLDAYLLNPLQHGSAPRPLRAILLDSATAFLWQDRQRDQIARVEEIGLPAGAVEQDRRENRAFVVGTLYAELVGELRRLRGVFGCVVVYTGTVWTRGVEGGAVGFRSSLPSPWGLFPALRIVVRAVAGAQGVFEGSVNTWGREDWPRRVVEALHRQRLLSFHAGVDGVRLETTTTTAATMHTNP